MELFSLLLLAHVIGIIVGVGGATVSDGLFFKTIKNRKISSDEYKLLNEAGKIIWSGFAIAILSGLGLLLYQYTTSGDITYWENAYFQAKLAIVSLILLNGIVFHSKVLPFMSNHLNENMKEEEFTNKFWLFSITGAISIVSWWSVVVLGLLAPEIPLSIILNIYALLIAFGALFGYLMMSHIIFGTEEKRISSDYVRKIFSINTGLLLLVIILIIGLGSLYHLDSQETDIEGTTHTVCVIEDPPWFDEAVLEIEPGDTVEWKYCDGDHGIHTHPIESVSGPEEFSSGFGVVGTEEEGEIYSHTFTEEGIYEYICPTHPYMEGKIVVGEEYHDEAEEVWPKQSNVNEEDILEEPEVPGEGEIWVNTQFENIEGQQHPGSITVLDAETWETKDVITDENFNNPHNLWNTYDNEYIYQTQWHGSILSKIDVEEREVVDEKEIGNAPAHLFVHPEEDTDRVYTTLNNEDRVAVTNQNLGHLNDIETSFGAHGIWIDPEGQYMSVAATLDHKLDIIDLEEEEVVESFEAPGFPLATQITHDGKYAMISLLLEGKVRFIDLEEMEHVQDVNVGEAPIWAMPGPENEYIFVPNTGSADVTVINQDTLEVEHTLDAGAGAHGISFGEKQAEEGYYGYVSNKYENFVTVIDYDEMETKGHIELEEDKIGGNGILTLPNPYTEVRSE